MMLGLDDDAHANSPPRCCCRRDRRSSTCRETHDAARCVKTIVVAVSTSRSRVSTCQVRKSSSFCGHDRASSAVSTAASKRAIERRRRRRNAAKVSKQQLRESWNTRPALADRCRRHQTHEFCDRLFAHDKRRKQGFLTIVDAAS